MSAQGALQGTEAAFGRGIPIAYGAKGMPSGGGASDAGSCAHAVERATEVCGVAGGRLHQGQERDSSGTDLWWATTQLRGAALLGEGLLRLNGGAR